MRAFSVLLLTGCALTPERAAERLDDAVARVVKRDDDVHHAVLHVSSETLGIDGTWVAGEATAGEPMTAQTPFLSASVGKLLTAATVLALADDGVLSLDAPITDWVDPALAAPLPLEAVTLRQLLGHTSGLPDYFTDETHDGAKNVLSLLTDAPERSWTPALLLAYTGDHFDAVGDPGEVFHYSDANYDLLGLAVEAATGQPFHAVVRETVLVPAGMAQTWYHAHESPPDDALAPAAPWFGEHNVAGTAAMSMDWAGGGLMTTTADLAAFLVGLEAGVPVTLSQLHESWTTDAVEDGIDYGYGLWRVRPDGLSRFLSSPPMLGASGFTGAFAYLVPEHGAVITGTFDQSEYAEEHIVFLLSRVLPTLDRIDADESP